MRIRIIGSVKAGNLSSFPTHVTVLHKASEAGSMNWEHGGNRRINARHSDGSRYQIFSASPNNHVAYHLPASGERHILGSADNLEGAKALVHKHVKVGA